MVGKFLKQQREYAQISQCELAKKTGIKQANISRWESDIQSPQIDAVIQLAQFYGITVDELIGMSDYDVANKPAIIEPPTQYYTQDEKQLVKAYRAMSPGKKKALFDMLDIEQTKSKKSTIGDKNDF